jgi:hypothetical protein
MTSGRFPRPADGLLCRSDRLPEPLALLKLALRSMIMAKERFPGARLARLIAARQDLDDSDREMLRDIL